MDFVSFDLEIAREIPTVFFLKNHYTGDRVGPFATHEQAIDNVPGADYDVIERPDDFENYRPLGISCAATARTGTGDTKLWYGDRYAPKMSRDECRRLVNYLLSYQTRGFIPLTWNGLGFDFRTLAEESDMWDECKELAWNHVDMMFHFFCIKGFAIGWDAAAKGMGITGKTKGMSGALAPLYWKQGKYDECLEYVSQDAMGPLQLARVVEQAGELVWITSHGKPSTYPAIIPEWLTAREANDLPLPDTSWMSDPWPRSKFTEWLGV